ncbi:HYC_CC_PP family protein [Mucilaginibacter polytrichastri]|uniref:Uncharacterized protein n=1 Tax=Mucilaginibacter polytrichastri TaxID=1302689 RepID=A0A1Q6A513_9SPHI|nr:hypothetical protein [Mucilaginibacter polytrichastri]OKS89100.1 hypothetical protein RG47T_4581 [Mucilaginibacter polytrichastri]SFS96518.1 hypothetical protein SAMN04487890_107142 [Mucilaginibacter polytrichastri]
MIKKSIALCLALLYTVTVLGFAINFHYCLNQVSSVQINEPVKKCSSLRVVKAMKCCKDKKVEVKVKDGHESSSLSFLAKTYGFVLPRIAYLGFSQIPVQAPAAKAFNRGPPDGLSSQPSIYLANRNFRI